MARYPVLCDVLSADERSRAERFAFSRDRDHFVVARGTLRHLLGAYVAVEPAKLHFQYGPEGKPTLVQPASSDPIHFNLSHAGDVALYAVARQPVGVDVECVRTNLSYEEIAERFFSPAERAALRGAAADRRRDVFFSCWTLKEAYIKGLGGGLSIPLDAFDVPLGEGSEPRPVRSRCAPVGAPRWSVRTLDLGTGYAGAVAASGNQWRATLHRWPPDADD